MGGRQMAWTLISNRPCLFWIQTIRKAEVAHVFWDVYGISISLQYPEKYIFWIFWSLASRFSNSTHYCLNCFMNPIQVVSVIKPAMTWYDKAFWTTAVLKSFFASLLQRLRSLCCLTLGLIVEKYICLCQKLDVERWHLWLGQADSKSRQWVDEARRCGPFLHFQDFWRFHILTFIQLIC